jgi:hypothetical protein
MICSRKEFEDLCKISKANYTTYRQRGKIYEQEDQDGVVVIDTEHPINHAFYESRKAINESKVFEKVKSEIIDEQPKPKYTPTAKNNTKEVVKKQIPSASNLRERANDETKSNGSEKFQLEIEKLKAEIRAKDIKSSLDEHRLATIVGNNIPAPIVTEMFAQLAKSLLTNYKSYIDQELTKFCHKNKIQDKERINILGTLVTGLNATHTKAVNDARSNMKSDLRKYKINDSMTDESDND